MGLIKKVLMIIGLLIILVVLFVSYVSYNVYNNIKDVEEMNLYECQDAPIKDYLTTFDCIYTHFVECNPAKIGVGVIMGEREGECLILLTAIEQRELDTNKMDPMPLSFDSFTNEAYYKCRFPYSYLNSFRDINDYFEAKENFTNLIMTLDDNEYCKGVGFFSIFFTRITK